MSGVLVIAVDLKSIERGDHREVWAEQGFLRAAMPMEKPWGHCLAGIVDLAENLAENGHHTQVGPQVVKDR